MAYDPHVVCRDIDLLHPAIHDRVLGLLEAARAASKAGTILPLEIFETYRGPERQRWLGTQGTTKAKPWESAHQFGLAADFVPRPNGRWSWDCPGCAEAFNWLRVSAPRFGLRNHISWDRPHVEYAKWDAIRNALRL